MADRYCNHGAAVNGNGSIGSPWNDLIECFKGTTGYAADAGDIVHVSTTAGLNTISNIASFIYPDWVETYHVTGSINGFTADKQLLFDVVTGSSSFTTQAIITELVVTPEAATFSTDAIVHKFSTNIPVMDLG